MKIHKEGYKSIVIAAVIFGIINTSFFYYLSALLPVVSWIILIASVVIFLFIVSFFRSPKRDFTISNPQIICPADGKVVVIEEIFDTEYFNDKRLQVSIFMSAANVHLNRIPMSGEVVYSQYHKGNYLKVGQQVTQGAEMGFIKFGSRVDVLLSTNATVDVKLNQLVKGGVTVLATI